MNGLKRLVITLKIGTTTIEASAVKGNEGNVSGNVSIQLKVSFVRTLTSPYTNADPLFVIPTIIPLKRLWLRLVMVNSCAFIVATLLMKRLTLFVTSCGSKIST